MEWTMALKDERQLRVVFPGHLADQLEKEAKQAGVTMADLIRLAVKERHERQLNLHPVKPGTVAQ